MLCQTFCALLWYAGQSSPTPKDIEWREYGGMRDWHFKNYLIRLELQLWVSVSSNDSLPFAFFVSYEHDTPTHTHINVNLKVIFIDILSIFGAIKILWLWMVFWYCLLLFHSLSLFLASIFVALLACGIWLRFVFSTASSKNWAPSFALALENRILCYFVY